MPPNTVYVGRPSQFGNDFSWQIRGREQAVKEYEKSLSGMEKRAIRKELKGKNLACWCPLSAPCHADVLLRLANP